MSAVNHLSDDQRMLHESAGAFARTLAKRLVNAIDHPWRQLWPEFAQQGWLSVLDPVDEGGFGGSFVDQALLAAALGEQIQSTPFMVSGSTASLTLRYGSGAWLQRHSQDVRSGRLRIALASEETPLDPMGASIRTHAERHGDGYRLSGAKRMILYGGDAEAFFVSATTDEIGPAVFIIPAASHGISVDAYRLIDGTQAADICFESVLLPSSVRLQLSGEDAKQVIDEAIWSSTFLAVSEGLGCLETSLEATKNHLSTREQFGRPLSASQVLRHRLADIYIAIEELRSLILAAATAGGWRERSTALSAAKIQLGHAGIWAIEQCVQLHGAMGVTEECAVGQALKRMTVLDRLFGGADFHIGRLSEDMLRGPS
ncbi:acyl-CoA dehydrogenase family protein [Sphingopyxis macrogoltabida]|uniref:Acyl-CoA dehydrogenase n=1 Tax=Sphingopyxis macrogoltabida TaxID=33050 RepID=A0AAC9AZ20_SPHMC|nr:acyl-CoA dehydrogenase [Sphingopyxis macrogoltabida]ALJ16375.1 hypothetical protein LH19_26600 [Sphingopyxis macrogoltabida]AMU92609.1 hypothetical protein ATM17_30585 [Sphingopyxis macrogoltabida]